MTTPQKDLVTEPLGTPGNIMPSSFWNLNGGLSRYESQSSEPNPDLQFPYSAVVYDEMGRSDGTVGSILRAIFGMMLKARWDLNGDADEDGGAAVPEETVRMVRTELGLPVIGKTLPRRRQSKVVFKEHLREAIRSLQFGFAVFEQCYRIGPDPQNPGQQMVHLDRLYSRPQRTIQHFLVEPQGELDGIVQTRPYIWGSGQLGTPYVFMPTGNLVVYSHEREGADWSGTSILRTAYKHWLIKDTLLRLSVQIVERNGMGVPIVNYDGTNVTKEEAQAFASAFRAGSTAGAALPVGAMLTLVGVQGSLVDPLPLMKYQDEAIANSALAMFLTLGHDNGARSLGDTFYDVFGNSLQQSCDFVADVITEQIIRPLVELNFGPDAPYPTLTPGDVTANGTLLAGDIQMLVDAGVIRPDDAMEKFIRQSGGLPPADEKTARLYPPRVTPGPIGGPGTPGMRLPDPNADVVSPNVPAPTPGGTDPQGLPAASPPYGGVDPNLPWQDRINQPIPTAAEERSRAASYAGYLLGRLASLGDVTPELQVTGA